MPIYPGSTSNINLYPTTPTELNIALYPPVESGGIALVQYSAATTADGSAAAVAQVLTNTIDVPTTITGSGNVNLTVYAAGFNGGVPLVVPCALTAAWTPVEVANQIRIVLNANGTFAAFFTASRTGAVDLVTFNTPNFNDPTAYFTVTPTTATGINASTSTITTAGALAGCSAQMPGSMIVTGIGAETYTYRGQYAGSGGTFPYYNLVGQASDPLTSSIANGIPSGDIFWYITNGAGDQLNTETSDPSPAFPNLASWVGSTVTASNITAGNQVFVGVSYDNTATIDTAIFVGGGALTLVPGTEITNGGITTAWYRGTAAGGETGVQFITDSAVRISIQAMEFSGVSSGVAEDVSTNSGNGEETVFNTVTPTSANNLIVGIAAYANATDAYVGGPEVPFTRLGTGTGGASVFQESMYAIQSAATAQNNFMSIQFPDSYDYATSAIALGAA